MFLRFIARLQKCSAAALRSGSEVNNSPIRAAMIFFLPSSVFLSFSISIGCSYSCLESVLETTSNILCLKSSYSSQSNIKRLIFNLSVHTDQTSSLTHGKWSVSVCDWVSSSLNPQFVRSSSQSRHHFSCFSASSSGILQSAVLSLAACMCAVLLCVALRLAIAFPLYL